MNPPSQRLTAVDLAAEIWPQTASVWRERAEAPGYGAHIRSWLSTWGEEVPDFPRDDAWLAADDLSAAYEDVPPVDRPATLASDAARSLQLLISLRDVFDPPVWRRVAVPGSITLEQLHWAIQDAMGWENDHMHAFYAGRELAAGTPLRELLPSKGSSFQYLYDFGDDWTHDIKSEGFFS